MRLDVILVVVLLAFGRGARTFRLDLFGVVPQRTLEDMGLEICVVVVVRSHELPLERLPSYKTYPGSHFFLVRSNADFRPE
jgi:hypothetical protein